MLDSHHDQLHQEHHWRQDYPQHQGDHGPQLGLQCREGQVHPKEAEKTKFLSLDWVPLSFSQNNVSQGIPGLSEKVDWKWVGHIMVRSVISVIFALLLHT